MRGSLGYGRCSVTRRGKPASSICFGSRGGRLGQGHERTRATRGMANLFLRLRRRWPVSRPGGLVRSKEKESAEDLGPGGRVGGEDGGDGRDARESLPWDTGAQAQHASRSRRRAEGTSWPRVKGVSFFHQGSSSHRRLSGAAGPYVDSLRGPLRLADSGERVIYH